VYSGFAEGKDGWSTIIEAIRHNRIHYAAQT